MNGWADERLYRELTTFKQLAQSRCDTELAKKAEQYQDRMIDSKTEKGLNETLSHGIIKMRERKSPATSTINQTSTITVLHSFLIH